MRQAQKPFLIAGPCSVESEEQLDKTISRLSSLLNPVFIRGGIWKPRTRPGSFEGLGEKAIPWLVASCRKYNQKSIIEVASKQHVELALKYGVDAVWIGARTTVNPFMVQEIAESLQGTDIPVLVKNPVNPDLELWIGALERIEKSGSRYLAAVHRGFSAYEKGLYRNKPLWEIPIELKRRLAHIPVICDPSHISGERSLIKSVCQTAIDLSFDGLMIESHYQPQLALSDAKQQLSPEELSEILKSVKIRLQEKQILGNEDELSELRTKIDTSDNFLMQVLIDRMKISDEIGSFKNLNNIAIHQPERWAAIVERCITKGKENGLSEEFIVRLFQAIHFESIRHQESIMKS